MPHALGRRWVDVTIGDDPRTFLVYVPTGYDGSTRMPLVFNLHGSHNEPDNHQDLTGIEPIADAEGFIVVAMRGHDTLWNALQKPELPDDVALASHILDWASQNICVDEKRIYSMGYSGGARTTSRLACSLPGTFAAIGPVAGLRHDDPCDPPPTPVITFHATDDEVNYFGGCAADDAGCNRGGEWVQNVEGAVADWATSNGCDPTPAEIETATDVHQFTYSNCADSADLIFYRRTGGNHAYDSVLGNPTQTIWDFFEQHQLP
jgi:polyhydroxybutyrate depolymerase